MRSISLSVFLVLNHTQSHNLHTLYTSTQLNSLPPPPNPLLLISCTIVFVSPRSFQSHSLLPSLSHRPPFSNPHTPPNPLFLISCTIVFASPNASMATPFAWLAIPRAFPMVVAAMLTAP